MTTKPKTRKPAVKASAIRDPIFAAIAEHKRLVRETNRLYDVLNKAEAEARGNYGWRPNGLIEWRNYKHAGESNLDRIRKECLARPDLNPEQVEAEYQDAKRRIAASEYEAIAWDHRAGTVALRNQYELARKAEDRAANKVARTKPTTPAGVATLIDYIRRDIKDEIYSWPLISLRTASTALAGMKAGDVDSAHFRSL
jgi:hypothetical protein